MSVMNPIEAADALAALAQAVRNLPYVDASMTVWMYPDRWVLSVDAGDSVDDVYLWQGPNLFQVAIVARAELQRFRGPDALPGPAVPEEERQDFLLLLQLLDPQKRNIREFPLDLAYVPRSRVSPAHPWELRADFGGGDVIYSGETPLAAMQEALGEAP